MIKHASRAGVLAVLVALLFGAVAWGAPSTPVITTPTPQPTATPRPLNPQERLALMRQSGFNASLVYLPLVSSGGYWDVNPHSFMYTVKPGDTLWSLALDFGRDLDTMSCSTTPTGADAEALTPGQTIVVPALADLCYTVRPGDTLGSIAAHNSTTIADIVAIPWNDLAGRPSYPVVPKQRILIPGARTDPKPRGDRKVVSRPSDQWGGTVYEDWPYGDGHFIWPVEGWISQGANAGHMALDIAVPLGTQVRAADRGKVIYAGWNPTGYGFRVVIDHGIDYVTLYAHLSDIYVETGQVVGKGQVIGLSGANGNITGPHLHFEIRDFGRLIDPRKVLP